MITLLLKKERQLLFWDGGHNHIYPKENEWLFFKIIENGGCIISEYEPDEEVNKKNFPIRNRLISGLSDSVLVVEAAFRSGSGVTARYAKEYGKTVYVIPNNIYENNGIGTNILIQEGGKLVIKPREIIKELKQDVKESIKNVKKEKQTEKIVKKTEKKEISNLLEKEELNIYRVLSDNPMHVNEIAIALDTSVEKIIPILTIIEIKGFIEQSSTNFFVRKKD